MKEYKSEDEFRVGLNKAYTVKRVDPYKPVQEDELPQPGERVRINGRDFTVARSEVSSGAFKYLPHLVIHVKI